MGTDNNVVKVAEGAGWEGVKGGGKWETSVIVSTIKHNIFT